MQPAPLQLGEQEKVAKKSARRLRSTGARGSRGRQQPGGGGGGSGGGGGGGGGESGGVSEEDANQANE
jgi:hypothetical protein